MNITDYIAESEKMEIAFLVKDSIEMFRLKMALKEKLEGLGLNPHIFNISHIWLREKFTNLHLIRSNWIQDDFRDLPACHCMFIEKSVGQEKVMEAMFSIKVADNDDFFAKEFRF